jgi:GNAT superfamily N-acetyltransferase
MSSQRTLSLSFRDFVPSDYERLEEIYNANYPDYAVSAAEQRARDESVDKSKYLLRRFVCTENRTDSVIGFGQVANVLDMYHPRKFMVTIYVDPQCQRMGVGGAIFDKLHEELSNRDAEVAWTMNREDLHLQRKFFERRGFNEKRRDWESRLDLSTFKPEKFEANLSRVIQQGISFTTLTEEIQGGENSLRKLYELVQHIAADMPRQADFTPLSYDQWKALLSNSPRLLPEGYVIAMDGSEFVGMSNLLSNEKMPRTLSQDDTGVRREYRGRGIATALKIKVIEFARKNGYESIGTWNDSTNAAMLAVNIKLGFKKQVGWILLEKTLA